jgi:F-type H+-transporting ATPase subunit delta
VNEQIIAKAYAKSIIELSDEQKVDVVEELNNFNILINKNHNFENLLFSEVFSVEEKIDVLGEVFKKSKVSSLVKNSLFFLLQEGRIGIFPMVYKEIVVLDDDRKGFLRGTIEGGDAEVNKDFKAKIKDYLEKKMGKKLELNYSKSDSVTAGYRVTVEDLQLDASLDNQLDKFKETVLNN